MQIYSRFLEEAVNGSEMPAGDPDKGLCARHVFEISSLSNIAGPRCGPGIPLIRECFRTY